MRTCAAEAAALISGFRTLLSDRPRRKIITSGCGGGLTFAELAAFQPPVCSDLTITPEGLASLIAKLQDQDSLYARARGVHTSALSNGERLLVVAEDIGRHNTLDRLRGECLRTGLDSNGLILLATGRISSEMIQKAVRMGCPIVASRTSPTSLSVGLARQWNITLCGYVRRNHMNVYSHPERLTSGAAGLEPAQFTLSIIEDARLAMIDPHCRGTGGFFQEPNFGFFAPCPYVQQE